VDPSLAAYLRGRIVGWLRKNSTFTLENGSQLHNFVDIKWEDYCDGISRDSTWGDHVSLVAVCEELGRNITIISSVNSENFIVEIKCKANVGNYNF